MSTTAIGSAGSLRSTRDFNHRIQTRLLAADAPTAVAEGWNRALQGAWSAWADGITIPSLPLYPTFATVVTGEAPPTSNTPMGLGAFISLQVAEMTAGPLAARLFQELGSVAENTQAQLAIASFSAILSARFITWLSGTLVTSVIGFGTVEGQTGLVTGSCQGIGVLSRPF